MATDNSGAVRALTTEADELLRSLRALRGAVGELGSTGGWFRKSNNQVLDVNSNLKYTRDMLGSMAKHTAALARETEKAKSSMEGVKSTAEKISSFGDSLKPVGEGLLGAGTTAARGLGVSDIHKEVVKDEASLQRIQTVRRLSNEDMKMVEGRLSAIARSTTQRRDALIPAFDSLMAKGYNVSEALERLNLAGRRATAQFTDVGETTQAIGAVGERLKLNMADTNLAMGYFTATAAAREGGASMDVVEKYMPELAGRAAVLKMEGPEAALQLGAAFQVAYDATGGDAEKANRIVSDLLDKLASEDVKAALKRQNIDVDQLIKSGKDPLLAVMDLFQRNPMVSPGGDTTPAVWALDTFPIRDLSRSLAPVLGKVDEYNRIVAFAKQNPAAPDAGFKEARGVTQNLIKQFHINMQERVRPHVEDLLSGFDGVLVRVNNSPAWQTILLAGAGLALAAGGLAAGAAKTAAIVGPLWGWFRGGGSAKKCGCTGTGRSRDRKGHSAGDKEARKRETAKRSRRDSRSKRRSGRSGAPGGSTGLSQAAKTARKQGGANAAAGVATGNMSRREFLGSLLRRGANKPKTETAPQTPDESSPSKKPPQRRTGRKPGRGQKGLVAGALILALAGATTDALADATVGVATHAVSESGIGAATNAVANTRHNRVSREAGRIRTPVGGVKPAGSRGSEGAVRQAVASSATSTVIKETAAGVASDAVADMALNRASRGTGRIRSLLGRFNGAGSAGSEAAKTVARSGAGRRFAFQGIKTALSSPVVRNIVFRGGVAGLGALATGPLLLGALGAAAVGTAGYFAYRNYKATGSIFRAPKKEPPAAPARAQAGPAPAAYAANTAALDRAIAGAVKSAAALSPMITTSLTGAAQLPRTLAPSFQVSSQLSSVTGTSYRTAAPLPAILMGSARTAAALPSLLAYAREAALRPGGSTQLTVHVHMAPGTSGDVAGQARRGALAAGPDMVKLINQTIDERRHREARTSYKTA